ncbi:hypothetical protein J8J14_13125 [Roseomonas sp. SSH11]|uniref:Uncharacterized protein n=1 Tax=Pararoseomonas baculiformis TaxID=2820812 RepID=A0ABS4AFA8_9PROT|nr:hypothetical protein [Pararoseomonas baculiformis]MBP0445716.1 hypothetical protein [Pararoseomonas baculiformis]
MASAPPKPSSQIASAVKLLAEYAAENGIHEAEGILMEILAVAHGWPAGTVEAAPLSAHTEMPRGQWAGASFLSSLPARTDATVLHAPV